MPDKSFKIGEDVFDIPDAEIGSFMKDYPDAVEVQSFKVDKDTLDIPITEVSDFLKDTPEAQPLGKKKEDTTNIFNSSSEAIQSTLPDKKDLSSGYLLKNLAGLPTTKEKSPSDSSTSDLVISKPESLGTEGSALVTPVGQETSYKKTGDTSYLTQNTGSSDIVKRDFANKALQKSSEEFNKAEKQLISDDYIENDAALEEYKYASSKLIDVLNNPVADPLQKQAAQAELQKLTGQYKPQLEKAEQYANVYNGFISDLQKKVQEVEKINEENSSYVQGSVGSLSKGTAGIIKSLVGVNNFLYSLIGVGPAGKEDLVNQLAEHLENGGDLEKMPNTIKGEILSGVMTSIPLIVETTFAPEAKYVGSLAPVMALNNFGQSYYNSENLPEALRAGAEGFGEGIILHGLGVGGSQLGSFVGKTTGGLGKVTSGVLDKTAAATVASVGFGGYDALKQYLDTGKIDMNSVYANAGVGLAFSLPGFVKAFHEKAVSDFLTASPEALKNAVEITPTPLDLRTKSVELMEKAADIKNPDEKTQAVVASTTSGKIANIKSIAEKLISDPDYATSLKLDIKNSDKLPPEEKQQAIDKIDSFISENDPKALESKPLEDQVTILQQGIELNNENKSISETQREIQNKLSEEKIKELKNQISNIYKPKTTENGKEKSGEEVGEKTDVTKENEVLTEQTSPVENTGEVSVKPENKKQDSDLTPQEKEIEQRFKKDLEDNYEERKAKYKEDFGNVFNTDNARIYSKDYLDSPETMSNATQIPARDFVNKMYQEELKMPAPEGKEDMVMFSAGGSGAGKSRALEHISEKPQIIVDTNFANFDRAIKDVDEALEAGKQVHIEYVYRDPVQAFLNGVMPRMKRADVKTGGRRGVPHEISTAIHDKSLKTIQLLAEHYKDNPNVQIRFSDNRYEKGSPHKMLLDDVKKITFDKSEVNKKIKDELDRQHKSGELSDIQYKGLTEGKDRELNEKRNDVQGILRQPSQPSSGVTEQGNSGGKSSGPGKEEGSSVKNSESVTEPQVKRIRSGNTTPKRRRPLSTTATEALKIEAKNPYELALQYFINKGQLHPSGIIELFGGGGKNTISEQRKRIGYLNKNGKTIEGIAHDLWESQPDYDQRYDTQDFRNAIEEVITNHNSSLSMAKDLLERNKQQVEDDYYKDVPEDIHTDSIDEAQDYWDKLSDEEKNKLANEADIEKFINDNPPRETLRAKELNSLIENKQNELSASRTALENKAKELDKGLNEDQKDLFGERKSEGGMFDERADPAQREKVLQPMRDVVSKHTEELKDLQSKLSEEADKEDNTLFDNESSQTKKAYEDIAGLTPNGQTGRIPVDPIIGGKSKAIKDILLDVSKSVNQRVLFSKTRRRALGTYSPGNSAIKIKFNGDLDTTAHELGHSIDDLFGILTDLKTNPDIKIESELAKFSGFGSKPPKGHPDPKLYERAEGFAEWLRAYVVNPKKAIYHAPELYKLYNEKVSAEYKKSLDQFSKDFRTFAGSSGRDMTLSNIEFKPSESEGLMKEIFSKKNTEDQFAITWADRLGANFVNQFTAFNKAFEFAKDMQGVEKVDPSKDPTILARLLLGIDGKYGEVLQHGMVDSENNVLKDSEGNAKNLKWLIEPLDNTDMSTIKKDVEDVVSYMVAERTVELSKKFNRNSVLTGIGGGVYKDVDVANKTLDEFNNGDPKKLERITKAADRYREFSDDILKYLVDKGRLAKEVRDKDGKLIGGYDFIKQNNLQYVALNRVMDTEPGREIDTSVGGKTNLLGSSANPVTKIKGSTKQIVNPYVSLMDNLHKSLKEADRNEVLKSFRDLLVNDRSMYDGDVKKLAEIGVLGKQGDKNAVTIFNEGKPEHWIFQKDVHDALKGLDNEAYKLPGILTFLPRTLRWTVTNYPTFAARNVIRDLQDRLIKTEDKSGFKDLFGDKEHWRELARSGGLNSGYYLKDKATYYGLLEEAMGELSKSKNTIVLDPLKAKNLWKGYQNILSKSETINRVAEYRAAYKNGKSQGMDDYNASVYAGYKSRDLMDFAVAGHYMKIINQIIPFSNASVQGLRKTILSAKENPAVFTAKIFAYSVMPQVALWIWNHRDEETAKQYESLPDYQRDMSHNFKIGDNLWVSVPKPYETSLPSASIDRTMSYYLYGNKKAFNGYGGSVAKSVLPIDEGNFAGPGQGIVEGVTNYDFFRNKSIVPPSENVLDLSLRNTQNASRLGKAIQEVAGIDARKIDHFIKSQFSYFGGAAVKLSDIGREKGGTDFGLTDLGFFKQTPAYNSKPVQEFMDYSQKWGLNNSRTMKEFSKLAQEYFNEKGDAEKEQKAQALIDYSSVAMKQWKDQNIEEKKISKHEGKIDGVNKSKPRHHK